MSEVAPHLRGYVDADCDIAIWLAIPIWWGPGTPWSDHRVWARALAEESWADCSDRPGEYEVDNLALTLAMCAERFGPDLERPLDPFSQTFLHLPHPRSAPLPVTVWVDGIDGDLRDYVVAEDPDATGPVEVTECVVPALGPGLRAFRRRLIPPQAAGEPGEEYAVLRYAWQLMDHQVTVVLTCSADPASIERTSVDIDALARTLCWQPG